MHDPAYELWLAWFAAHLLGDFVFQTDWMVAQKQRVGVLCVHAAVLGVLSWLLAGRCTLLAIFAAAIIALTHGLIDFLKSRLRCSGSAGFMGDQLAHLAIITVLTVAFRAKLGTSLWTIQLGAAWLSGLIVVSGLILCVYVAGHLIGFAVQPYLDEILAAGSDSVPANLESPARGLTRAGRVIGRWERALIFLLVFVGQPGGIGFLIAAKSIFRFGELKEPANRREAEYITIGTLMSFGVALAIAYATVAWARSVS